MSSRRRIKCKYGQKRRDRDGNTNTQNTKYDRDDFWPTAPFFRMNLVGLSSPSQERRNAKKQNDKVCGIELPTVFFDERLNHREQQGTRAKSERDLRARFFEGPRGNQSNESNHEKEGFERAHFSL
ncbi:MAG TPA: hypothetical protein PKA58_37945 [Polyangium sp.]|nr:hypothetical protein [Polyangium sp.]